jgi:hypothetical protein
MDVAVIETQKYFQYVSSFDFQKLISRLELIEHAKASSRCKSVKASNESECLINQSAITLYYEYNMAPIIKSHSSKEPQQQGHIEYDDLSLAPLLEWWNIFSFFFVENQRKT